jgi:uncharacterized protein YodC (DUF2158 family)
MSTKPNDGGPAFPRSAVLNHDGTTYHNSADGMTLRDWFAGQALAGTTFHWGELATYLKHAGAMHDAASVRQFMAGAAYAQADAMIAERNKE